MLTSKVLKVRCFAKSRSRILHPSINNHFLTYPTLAPFNSNAGPGVLPFFDGCGPFATWLPRSQDLTPEDIEAVRLGTLTPTHTLPTEVEGLIDSTIQKIHSAGGRVVGLIGFSQGARVVAGVLRGLELRQALGSKAGEQGAWVDSMQFGVTVCGSWPPPLVPASILRALDESGIPDEEKEMLLGRKIAVPAFHAVGKQDEKGRWTSKALIEGHFEVETGKSCVEECEMGHQYPVAREETEKIRNWIVGVLSKTESEDKM